MKQPSHYFLIAVLLITAPVLAHPGPRVWIGNVNGRLATYTSNNDVAPSTYSPMKVFIGGGDPDTLVANGRLDEYPVPGTQIFATDFPGYQVRLDHQGDAGGGGAAYGTTFSFKLAGPLLVYDPSSKVYRTSTQAFGNPGPTPQIGYSAGGTSHTAITGNGPRDGFAFYSYNGPTDHAHLVATLLPSGAYPPPGQSPGDGPHVVYAVPLQLTSSSYGDSLPFCILYGRGLGYPDDQEFVDAQHVAATSFGLPGDANLDGKVDVTDLGILATHWQGIGFWTDADFSNDGMIDVTDLGVLATHWQAGVSGPAGAIGTVGLANVPEPGVFGIGAIFVLSMRVVRRRDQRYHSNDAHSKRSHDAR